MRRLVVAFVVVGLLAAGAFVARFPSAVEPGYRFERAWGDEGSGPAELDGPIGIALWEMKSL